MTAEVDPFDVDPDLQLPLALIPLRLSAVRVLLCAHAAAVGPHRLRQSINVVAYLLPRPGPLALQTQDLDPTPLPLAPADRLLRDRDLSFACLAYVFMLDVYYALCLKYF